VQLEQKLHHPQERFGAGVGAGAQADHEEVVGVRHHFQSAMQLWLSRQSFKCWSTWAA
jgi:hypothetical protein